MLERINYPEPTKVTGIFGVTNAGQSLDTKVSLVVLDENMDVQFS